MLTTKFYHNIHYIVAKYTTLQFCQMYMYKRACLIKIEHFITYNNKIQSETQPKVLFFLKKVSDILCSKCAILETLLN